MSAFETLTVWATILAAVGTLFAVIVSVITARGAREEAREARDAEAAANARTLAVQSELERNRTIEAQRVEADQKARSQASSIVVDVETHEVDGVHFATVDVRNKSDSAIYDIVVGPVEARNYEVIDNPPQRGSRLGFVPQTEVMYRNQSARFSDRHIASSEDVVVGFAVEFEDAARDRWRVMPNGSLFLVGPRTVNSAGEPIDLLDQEELLRAQAVVVETWRSPRAPDGYSTLTVGVTNNGAHPIRDVVVEISDDLRARSGEMVFAAKSVAERSTSTSLVSPDSAGGYEIISFTTLRGKRWTVSDALGVVPGDPAMVPTPEFFEDEAHRLGPR